MTTMEKGPWKPLRLRYEVCMKLKSVNSAQITGQYRLLQTIVFTMQMGRDNKSPIVS